MTREINHPQRDWYHRCVRIRISETEQITFINTSTLIIKLTIILSGAKINKIILVNAVTNNDCEINESLTVQALFFCCSDTQKPRIYLHNEGASNKLSSCLFGILNGELYINLESNACGWRDYWISVSVSVAEMRYFYCTNAVGTKLYKRTSLRFYATIFNSTTASLIVNVCVCVYVC